MAKGDLIFINHEHQILRKKEETESILIRLDEVKQKNLNSDKNNLFHFSHWFLKCICGQFKTKIWILHILKINFTHSWELCPFKCQSTWLLGRLLSSSALLWRTWTFCCLIQKLEASFSVWFCLLTSHRQSPYPLESSEASSTGEQTTDTLKISTNFGFYLQWTESMVQPSSSPAL